MNNRETWNRRGSGLLQKIKKKKKIAYEIIAVYLRIIQSPFSSFKLKKNCNWHTLDSKLSHNFY